MLRDGLAGRSDRLSGRCYAVGFKGRVTREGAEEVLSAAWGARVRSPVLLPRKASFYVKALSRKG